MRPNVRTTREALNAAALPPTKGMELDYRTEPHRWWDRAKLTFDTLLGGMTLVIVWTLVLRISGAYTATIPFLVIVAFLCVLLAFSIHLGPFVSLVLAGAVSAVVFVQSPQVPIPLMLALVALPAMVIWLTGTVGSPKVTTWILLGPCFWLLSVASNTAFFAVFLVAGVAVALVACEALTRHYAVWLNANPHLPRRTRRRWLAVWGPIRRRSAFNRLVDSLLHPRTCRHSMLATELAERTRYLLGYLVVVVAGLAAVLIYLICGDPLLRGTLAVAALVVLLGAYGIVNVLTYCGPERLPLALSLVGRAVSNWCTYNAHDTRAPGVFQSPFGPAVRRRRLLLMALGAVTIVLLPASWYFPVGARVFGIDGWLNAAGQTQHLLGDYIPGYAEDVQLSSADQKMLERMPQKARDDAQLRLLDQRRRESAARASYARLVTIPEYAVVLHVRSVFSLQTTAIFSALLSLIGCFAAPVVVLMAAFWAVSARVLLHHHLTLEGQPGQPALYHSHPPASRWIAYVRRLRESRFRTKDELGRTVAERNHLLVGFNETADYPVLLSPGILEEHAHITGDSGSGKSSLGIAPLIEQLIERGDCSVVLLDLKDEMPMFEAARLAVARTNAHRNGRPALPFRWFTNQTGRSTYVFNPILQRDMQQLSPQQRAEVLLSSLGLDYGEGFGPSFYSSVHRHVLNATLENNPHFKSFRQIDRFFRDGRFAVNARDVGIDRKAREEGSHLYTVIQSLASFDALNVLDDTPLPPGVLEQRIDMGDVVREPHVLYFGLASALEQKSVREIAKLALHSLLVAAVRRGHSKHQVYLFIDEFQQVVSQDLEIVLRQARSHGVSVILANQTLSDLKKGGVDITPTVQANTRFRQVFSSSDLQHQNALIEASGEAMYELFSWSIDDPQTPYVPDVAMPQELIFRVQEQIGPRLRRNDLIEATDHPLRSLVQVTRGHGFTQFGGMIFPMRSIYHISPETYRRRQAARWPAGDAHPGTIVTPLDPALFGEAPKSAPAQTRPPGPDAQLLMELEKTLDSYQGVPKHDQSDPDPQQ